MPKIRKGIMVRIVDVATTKTDANTAPAVPACCARVELSIGDQPTVRGETFRGVAFPRALS
jgi:hypothetical protein